MNVGRVWWDIFGRSVILMRGSSLNLNTVNGLWKRDLDIKFSDMERTRKRQNRSKKGKKKQEKAMDFFLKTTKKTAENCGLQVVGAT